MLVLTEYVLQILHLGRANDGSSDFGQRPSDSNLSHRDASLIRELLDSLDDIGCTSADISALQPRIKTRENTPTSNLI